jgi:hypothetical protein
MADELLVRFPSAAGTPELPVVMHTRNRRGFPFFSEWRRVAPGEFAIRYPKEQPFALDVLYEIPGFGRAMTLADNEGLLYRLGDPPVDFRLEAAKTRAAGVERLAREIGSGGTTVPRDLVERVERLVRDLASAVGASPAAGEQSARRLDRILCDAFWIGEHLELARARARIAAMSLEERRAKLFGASFFDVDESESTLYRFEELFNFATTPFYRRQVEPVEGSPDWDTRDRLLDWLDRKGIPRKGHPLSWWIRYGLPDWMKKLSYKTLKEVVYKQVFDTVTRYRGRIRIWDVINEAHDPIVKGNELNLDRDQVFEITELACRATRDADPQAVRIVNVNRPWGDYSGR